MDVLRLTIESAANRMNVGDISALYGGVVLAGVGGFLGVTPVVQDALRSRFQAAAPRTLRCAPLKRPPAFIPPLRPSVDYDFK